MKFRYLKRGEKVFVFILGILAVLSFWEIFERYSQELSSMTPDNGGMYTEGMVGKIGAINPLFSQFNPVDRDISSLVFSGLMKYDYKTGELKNDLATHTLDFSKKVYTFTLKENVLWHDNTKVSADDIVFTFQEVIQSPDFQNQFLKSTFENIEIKKIDDTSVSFTLQRPYKFFLSNLTVGILPKHILTGIPIKNLYFSEFNTLNPVGTGPYKVTTIFQNTLPEKVVLQKFESYFDTEPFIEHLEFHIFPSKDQLFQSRDTLDGIQSISSQERSLFESSSRFQIFSYSLPQYVAAFLNTESPKLSHIKSRLGLALGIEKSKILQELSSVIPVSTPLLELDTSHWLLQYDTEKAQGGLSDAGFKLPSKQTITEEIKKENFITAPNNGENFATQETSLFLEGITPEGTQKVLVNNYELKLFSPEKKTFSYKMSTDIGTLKKGENTYKIEIEQNGQKKELQTFTLFLASSSEEQEREQQKYDAQKKEEETPNEPREIPNDSFRIDSQGNPFVLSLLTPENPPEFTKIAYFLKDEWAKIGVDSKIEILSPEQLQERVQNRDYDVLIFGQNLGYNLDAYPYWHSSQANHGFNFSQLKNFEIDALLESIRSTHDEERRQKDLEKLETVLIEEMPAIFFYKPQHFFALSPKIKTLSPFTLQEEQDRISHIESWYINETFTLKQKRTLSSFLDWLLAELFL